MPMIFQCHSPFVSCNCKSIYNPIRTTDNNRHSGLFAITSRADFRSIYFIEKEISIRHRRTTGEKRTNKTNRLETTRFALFDTRTTTTTLTNSFPCWRSTSFVVQLRRINVANRNWCRRHSLRHRTNRSSSNNTNYIRYAGKTIGSILFCLRPLWRCVVLRMCVPEAELIHSYYYIFLYVRSVPLPPQLDTNFLSNQKSI